MTQTETRVARGAALLDERNPGWRKRICLDDLEVKSSFQSILELLYGDFDEGIQVLSLSEQDAVQYGFEADDEDINEDEEFFALWEEFVQAWKEAIEDRKE